jgi:hypothetical protein
VIAKKETLMKAIGYLSIVALTAACLEARANGAIENVLVTGTYSPANALTSAVSVLDEQQIRALNKRTVAGLLKTGRAGGRARRAGRVDRRFDSRRRGQFYPGAAGRGGAQ